jgi:serpin B
MNRILSHLTLTVSALAFVAAMQSCSDNGESSANELKPIELSRAETEVSTNLSGFSMELLNAVIKSHEGTCNVAVSPLGAAMVAGMIGNAVDDQTRSELLSSMDMNPEDLESLNAYCAKMLTALPVHDKSSKLMLANSVWLNNSLVQVQESYKDLLETDYLAQVSFADFTTSGLMSDINGWASKVSDGNIPSVLRKAPAYNDYGVWLNTLYFKGLWANKFNESKTKKEEFTVDNGSTVLVDMMSADHGMCAYRVIDILDKDNPVFPDDFYATSYATMFYGNGGFALTAVMPDSKVGIEDFMESLPLNFWSEIQRKADTGASEDVRFPKLKLNISTDLISPMSQLGASKIFSKIGLPALSVENGAVNQFEQNISFEVDENGSTVKVTTGAYIGPSDNISGPIVFNRPFIFFIWEKTTGTILLEGAIMNPAN